MRILRILVSGVLCFSLLSVPQVWGADVTLELTSPQSTGTVTPGSTISWSIEFTVSSGDNLGLALLVVDLEQDADNPELFDLSPASEVPSSMSEFARPNGICNPAEGGASSGYVGVLRGPSGSRQLRQIGGAQNTFGAAAVAMGLDVDVSQGIGQGGSAILASGSLTLPGTPGDYTFRLANAVANVLEEVNVAPEVSKVLAAAVILATPELTFSVERGSPAFVRGDCNGDGALDISDPVALLSHLFLPQGTSPSCEDSCDANDSGSLELADALAALNSMFLMQGPLPPPSLSCGVDPTPETLGCDSFAACP